MQDEPPVFADLQRYWQAFWMLNRSRQLGMVAGPIPLTEILAYLQMVGDPRPEYLLRVIDELDREYLKHLDEQRRAASPAKGKTK